MLRIGVLVKELVAYIKDLLAPASARQVVMYYHVGRRPLAHGLFGSREPRGVAAVRRGISHYDHRYGHVRLCRRAFYVRVGIYGVEHRHVVSASLSLACPTR